MDLKDLFKLNQAISLMDISASYQQECVDKAKQAFDEHGPLSPEAVHRVKLLKRAADVMSRRTKRARAIAEGMSIAYKA